MSALKVVIIDYGSGNLRSAEKATARAADDMGGGEVLVSNDPAQLASASHIILPGVGAFRDCRLGLDAVTGMVDALTAQVIGGGKPFLGICVGMQLLATIGREHGDCDGLGWIPGEVAAITPADKTLKIPHMGWNNMLQEKEHSVLNGLNNKDFYFVHSYRFKPKNNESILANTNYGEDFPSVLCSGNIIGTQFHPEKSQGAGIALLKNFLEWAP